ncbi:hypothetical protein ACJX0J_023551, partial [Zea mays]
SRRSVKVQLKTLVEYYLIDETLFNERHNVTPGAVAAQSDKFQGNQRISCIDFGVSLLEKKILLPGETLSFQDLLFVLCFLKKITTGTTPAIMNPQVNCFPVSYFSFILFTPNHNIAKLKS